MIRIPAQGDRADPAEERKKARAIVISNVCTFAFLVLLIRIAPFTLPPSCNT